VLNWRVIGMTAGVVLVVLVAVMSLPLIRGGSKPSEGAKP
jgi:hypothetical protein